MGRQGVEDITRFQYIKEIHIDYGNVPIRYRDNAIITTSASSSNDTSSYYTHGSIEDPIIESYDILEKNSPTLYEILGLLKRIYFMQKTFLTDWLSIICIELKKYVQQGGGTYFPVNRV